MSTHRVTDPTDLTDPTDPTDLTDPFHSFSNFRELVNTKYTESWSQFGKQGYPSSIHEVSPLALERLSTFRAVSQAC